MARILIVDDEEMICDEFRDILSEENHEVDTALNGMQALQKIDEKKYDLVFLDVLMPRMEGREVYEEIKKRSPVPVAIMSGYLPPNKEQDVLKMGAVACLRKPLDLNKIHQLIKSVCAKS